jgi:hypothetical protein
VLFQKLHIGDDHAPVHGFAHVVDGEQGHLHGREGFHFNACLAVHLGGGGADKLFSFFDFIAHISWVSGTGLGQNFDANPPSC